MVTVMSALISAVEDLIVLSAGSRLIVIRDLETSATKHESCILSGETGGSDQAQKDGAEVS